MPPPPKRVDPFDRDRLTVTIAGVEIDLRKVQSGPEGWLWLNQTLLAVPAELKAEAFDALDDAAWEVFASRRFGREAFFEGGEPESFDLYEKLDAGFHLDWDLGVCSPPRSDKPGVARVRPLFSIEGDPSGRDELIQEGYLERGGALLIAGQTGIGKSSLAMQFSVSWALGEETLGFSPSKPLASLIVQAENGDGDISKMRAGVANGFGLSLRDEGQVNDFVAVARVDEFTGRRFGDELQRLIRYWAPDVVFLDPLLAFVGGDVSKQEVASEFLREILQPIIRRARIGLVALHHTGKPPRDPKESDQQTDYLGFGSSELANWPRGIVGIRRDPSTRGLFRLDLGKRGQNLEWTNDAGERVYSKMLRHSKCGIFWEEVEPEQEAAVAAAAAPSQETVFQLVPATGSISKEALIARARDKGIGEKKAAGWLAVLIEEKRLHQWLVPRPKTNPARHISRHPQPDPTSPDPTSPVQTQDQP